MAELRFIHGPGIVQDHAGRTLHVGPTERAYMDENGRIVVRDDNPHGLLHTIWAARKKGDVPTVKVVGVQAFTDDTIELVVSPVEFGDELTDEFGERVAARSITLDDLLAHWTQRVPADEAIERVSDALRKLDRLG